jgi:hypothetical protein
MLGTALEEPERVAGADWYQLGEGAKWQRGRDSFVEETAKTYMKARTSNYVQACRVDAQDQKWEWKKQGALEKAAVEGRVYVVTANSTTGAGGASARPAARTTASTGARRAIARSDCGPGGAMACRWHVKLLMCVYGWIPHNAGFGFLDLTPATLGQIHF